MLISMFHIRGRLAPAKAEMLIVMRENQRMVQDFKLNSHYSLNKSEHNAFEGVELETVEGGGATAEEEEEFQLYLEDLEAEESGEDNVEEAAEEQWS